MLKVARFTSLFFALAASLRLDAALPELSSIDPIEYDEASQRLIARGDARLDYGDTRLRADRITYYQEYTLADALGNVVISHDGNRLIADRLNYEVESNIFSVDRLKSGQWPFYVTGVNAGGTTDEVQVEGATIYYGNPGKFTPSISADTVLFSNEEEDSVTVKGATLRIGSFPFLRLPKYTYYIENPPYYIDFSAGEEGELGAYFQSTFLIPFGEYLRTGFNIDYYTDRGALGGPAVQYVYNTDTQSLNGAISTGFIDDQGSTSQLGVDRLGNAIDQSREFAEWRHKHYIGERLSATASVSYWSDSEVTRDFRRDIYHDNQLPDNFAEIVYAGDNYLVSAFGRFDFNDFQLTQRRLPEVRFDLLPTPIANTGAYHRASASYAILREDFDEFSPLSLEETEVDRLDLTYHLERPVHFKDWLTFTPLVGGRFSSYENQSQDPALPAPFTAIADDNGEQSIWEAGFDLELRGYRRFDTINETWGIDGLRHLIKPVVRYRYYSDPEDLNEAVAIDRQVLDLDRPVLNLSDLRNVDQIDETHLVRMGVENLFQTRAENYGSRTLAALNFYQDVLLDKDTRYDGSEEDTFNASWIEFTMAPAPWIKFELAKRFRTKTLTLEEFRTRTVLTSGEVWQLGLSTDLVDAQVDQYRIDFMYRINERYSFLQDIRFDADNGEFTELSFGLRSKIGSVWEVFYALTFREDARRESDVAFNVKLKLLDPEF